MSAIGGGTGANSCSTGAWQPIVPSSSPLRRNGPLTTASIEPSATTFMNAPAVATPRFSWTGPR